MYKVYTLINTFMGIFSFYGFLFVVLKANAYDLMNCKMHAWEATHIVLRESKMSVCVCVCVFIKNSSGTSL